MRIGRYRLKIGKYFWLQPLVPVRIKHFWYFWLFIEARPTDVDKKPLFQPNTLLEHNGRIYRYTKADKSMKKDELLIEQKDKEDKN